MPEPLRFDVLIVGAGPAGLAAASAASGKSGVRIAVVDENAEPGGQIHRGIAGSPHQAAQPFIESAQRAGVTFLRNTTIVDAPAPGVVMALGPSGIVPIQYGKLIVATGARELFLPFPGWTLPNVMGVGGLQAMVKSGLDVSGKRIVVAGTGPLLLAVGAYLKQHGANVVVVAEQADFGKLAAFMPQLLRIPSKFSQGASLIAAVGSRLRAGTWVEFATGKDKLSAVKLNRSNREVPCDYLACAYGFAPNLELPMILGCEIKNGFVAVDGQQQTSIENVFCAGEPTGIGGLDSSTVEGTIAGFVATGQSVSEIWLKSRRMFQSFGDAMDRTFALRSELKALARSETIVCRCEDVKLGQLAGFESAKAAKLHTRCGMGPCQGRICGPATRFLYGWEHGSVRPPLVPTPLSGLMDAAAPNQTA